MAGTCCDRAGLWVVGSLAAGLGVGLAQRRGDEGSADTASRVMGWMYFFCWSVSFYPQIVLNWQRKATTGLSLDFQVLNWVGFGCYAVYNTALFASQTIRDEYVQRNGAPPPVHPNDVLFAVHAVAATSVTLGQVWCFRDTFVPPPPSVLAARLRLAAGALVGGVLLVVAVMSALLLARQTTAFTYLDVLYVLSAAKLGITVFKYIPQVAQYPVPAPARAGGCAWCLSQCVSRPSPAGCKLQTWATIPQYLELTGQVLGIPQVLENARRRSTRGWNIHNVILDLGGGSLSIAQLLLDCSKTRDWTPLLGNPAKLLLGNVSILFDLIFLAQHYCLYPAPGSPRAQAAAHAPTTTADDAEETDAEDIALLARADTAGQDAEWGLADAERSKAR
jgi:cystinosin